MRVVIGCLLATRGKPFEWTEPTDPVEPEDKNIYLIDDEGNYLVNNAGAYLTCGEETA